MKSLNLIALEVVGFHLTLRWYCKESRSIGFRNLGGRDMFNGRYYPQVSLDLWWVSVIFERYYLGQW